MRWELWDTETNNLLMDFPSEEAGLDYVWELIARDGIAVTFALKHGPFDGPDSAVIGGLTLAERAFNHAATDAARQHATR